MASSSIPPLSSYSTALVLLPLPQIQSRINPLRSANDKSFPRWTSHLTMVFPFVEPSQLPKASSLIRDALSKAKISPFMFQLDKVDRFKQRDYDTVFLGSSKTEDVHRLWDAVSSAVAYKGRPFIPHLTLGQAHHREKSLAFLRGKGQLLLRKPIEWQIGSVIVLRKSEVEGGLMKIYEEIPLLQAFLHSPATTLTGLHPTGYHFATDTWTPAMPAASSQSLKALILATYNILSDSDHPITTRIPHLLSTLLAVQPIPDVVCLQEVTDDFLYHLLADPLIRARWPWCTHDPTSVLPDERNIIFLAREPFGFTWEHVHLRGKHKPAVVLLIPRREAQPLVIAGIHLTAGLAPAQRRTKLEELEMLLAFLRQRHSASPWIIVGDSNIPTSQPIPATILDTLDDAWLSVQGSEDGGATYDPSSNALAAETVKEDRSPQRYDRVWVRRDVGIRAQAAEKFGQAESASDHYGLTATLQFSDFIIDSRETLAIKEPTHRRDTAGVVAEPTAPLDEELERFVRQEGGFPTEAMHAERTRVTATLRAVISLPTRPTVEADAVAPGGTPDTVQPQSVVRFEFIPVGSFGLGVDTQSSDLDVLVVGNISPGTFWAVVRARLQKSTLKSYMHDGEAVGKETTPSVVLKRFVKDASVQMMELLVGNVRVDMQYCSASRLLESWDKIHELDPVDPLFLLPAPSLRMLNAYRDMLRIQRALPATSLAAFRLALRALKLFCVFQGIHSSRLGYLGGIHITLLLTRVSLLSPPNSSASHLIHAFFATYADWDWAQQPVIIPQVNDKTSYTRSPGREPMVILSIEKPVINVVQNANKHTTTTIASTLKKAHRHLAEGAAWADVCGSAGVCGTGFQKNFLCSHESYIKVDLSFWGRSLVKARSWIGYVESRLPHLLVMLQTSLPDCGARLWPVRLIDGNSPGDLSTGLQSFYLVGFDVPKEPTSGKNVYAPLHAFEDQLRRNEKFYDATEMYVSVSPVNPSQLPETITTPVAWPDGGIDPEDDTSDEDDTELLDEVEEWDTDAAFAAVSAKQIKKNRPQQSKGSTTSHIPAPKLRTSADVYNRIVWDRELATEDYLIGYTDRFAGLQEMPLSNWKRDIEHEDFVPFHRVVHFRRKSDGVLVWDRRNKVDLVFGSGVQQRSS